MTLKKLKNQKNQCQNESDLVSKLIFKRTKERLFIKILMFYIANVVQFNELFQKISFLLIFDDFLVYLLGQNFNNLKFSKFTIILNFSKKNFKFHLIECFSCKAQVKFQINRMSFACVIKIKT